MNLSTLYTHFLYPTQFVVQCGSKVVRMYAAHRKGKPTISYIDRLGIAFGPCLSVRRPCFLVFNLYRLQFFDVGSKTNTI